MRKNNSFPKKLPQGVLRKCVHCGLEAHTPEELELFSHNPHSYLSRENICKKCENAERLPLRAIDHEKRVNFKGDVVWVGHNPRKNVCSICGKKYPEDLKRRTHLHHIKYDEKDPLANVVELCASCHKKLHLGQIKLPEEATP